MAESWNCFQAELFVLMSAWLQCLLRCIGGSLPPEFMPHLFPCLHPFPSNALQVSLSQLSSCTLLAPCIIRAWAYMTLFVQMHTNILHIQMLQARIKLFYSILCMHNNKYLHAQKQESTMLSRHSIGCFMTGGLQAEVLCWATHSLCPLLALGKLIPSSPLPHTHLSLCSHKVWSSTVNTW